MALIDYLHLADTRGAARETLEAFKDRAGQSPLIYEALAHNPDMVVARNDYFTRVMDGGVLDRPIKEFAHITVSVTNACEYCVGAHSNVLLERMGGDPAEVAAIERGDLDGLDVRKRAVAEFARQLTLDPKQVSESHIDALRDAGFDEAGIVELLVVVASAKAANTIVDGLDIHPSDR